MADLHPAGAHDRLEQVGDYCECCDPDVIWCANRQPLLPRPVSPVADPEGVPMSDERRKALTEAWQAVQREVTPLGGYSPWNDGFTTALNKALNAILALREEAGEVRAMRSSAYEQSKCPNCLVKTSRRLLSRQRATECEQCGHVSPLPIGGESRG